MDYKTLRVYAGFTQFRQWYSYHGIQTLGTPYASRPIAIKATYNDDGDIGVVAYLNYIGEGVFHQTRRVGGTWSTWGFGLSNFQDLIVQRGWWSRESYAVMKSNMNITQQVSAAGGDSFKGSCGHGTNMGWAKPLPELRNLSIAFDGDFLITWDFSANNYSPSYTNVYYTTGTDRTHQAESQLWYGIIGGGDYLPKWVLNKEPMIDTVKLTATELMITSVKDFQNTGESVSMTKWRQTFAPTWMGLGYGYDMNLNPDYGGMEASGGYASKGRIVRDVAENTFGEAIAYSYLYRPKDRPVMLSTFDGKSVHFYRMRKDLKVKDGVFSFGEQWINYLPLALCGNDDYIFAYNNNQLLISPQVGEWEKPTIGTGLGAYFDIDTDRVISITEQATVNQPANLEIVLNNYDGYYDVPGAGAIDDLKVGSQVSLYLGYEISGADEIEEYKIYYVDTWGYTREPNASYFILKCVDAWGLLEQYVFPVEVRFNQFEDETTYTVYEIIEMLVNSIGGTLTFETKSTDIDTILPRVKTRTGENAGSLVRRLLQLVPDQLKFFGLEGTIIYPQTTDTAAYKYKFPVTYS